MMPDDTAGVDEIDAGPWHRLAVGLPQCLGDALADEIDARHAAIAMAIFALTGDVEHGGGDFKAGDVRADGAVIRQHARRTAGATAQVEHA